MGVEEKNVESGRLREEADPMDREVDDEIECEKAKEEGGKCFAQSEEEIPLPKLHKRPREIR